MVFGATSIGLKMMSKVTELKRGRLGRFSRDEGGAMIILALFFFITLIVVMGLSIDLMRYELFRSRLQATMDRALLAAAHPDQEHDRHKVVVDYFERAGLGGTITDEDVTVTEGIDGIEVSATASGYIGMPFSNFMSDDAGAKLKPSATGTAAKLNKLTEVSLVVDVSGSMGWNSVTGRTRLYEMQKASKQFVNLLLCDPNDPDESNNCTIKDYKTAISLVPYSTQVNVGKDILKHFTRVDAQDIAYCTAFYDEDFNQAYIKTDGTGSGTKLRQAAKFYRYGSTYKNTYSDDYLSCHTDEWREIVGFEHSATKLNQSINALQAKGDTAIDIGMKWGAALLHHEAQPAVDAMINEGIVDSRLEGRPYDLSETDSAKFIVLLTDGQNTNHHYLYDGFRTGPSPFWLNTYGGRDIISVRHTDTHYMWYYPATGETVWKTTPYGQHGSYHCFYSRYHGQVCTPGVGSSGSYTRQLSYEEFWGLKYTWGFVERFSWLGSPGRLIQNANDTDGDGNRDIDQRLLNQCEAAKQAGMTIYTIMLEADGTETAGAMEQCATIRGGERLHYRTNGLDISSLFSRIATDINKLRLVK